MKLLILSIGKSHEAYVKQGIEDFTSRLNRYFPTEWKIISSVKNAASLSEIALKRAEASLVFTQLKDDDHLIVLDERGKILSSPQVATLLQQKANTACKRLVFLIGGAFGVDASILQKSDFIWSFSHLVFPHMLMRLMLSEQLYRACTILNNEKYHHL